MHGKNTYANVRHAICTAPLERPTHTENHAGQSNVLPFEQDNRGICSFRMAVESAEEEEICIVVLLDDYIIGSC